MNVILLIACIGMITGFFILLSLSPMEFTDSVFKNILNKPRSIKEEINEITKRKKVSYFRREVIEVQSILKLTGREGWFPMICAVSLFLFAIGSGIAIVLGNFFSVPVLGIGFMLLPFWYVRLTQTHFKRDIAAELETALSIITTAYLRNEDIVTAVEENISYLNPPVSEVFGAFLMQVRMVDPDIDAALHTMKRRIDNEVFGEWCDALSDCQRDRSLKTTLVPIVSKLSDMRNVNAELEYLIAEPRKEFLIMVIFVVGNIPLMYLLNKEWYGVLMHTVLGQVILAGTAAAIFISAGFVVKLTRPIEYRR